MTVDIFWKGFLKAAGKAPETKYNDCFSFDLTEKVANELLALVLSGKKRATTSSLRAFECKNEAVPQPGDYSIVTDWTGTPRCVIETTNVTIIPFDKVTFDLCSREGEDDSLVSWQESHRHFFTEEGKLLGYSFAEDMTVVFEDFKLVYVG